ncbi:MAG: ABC transporter permease [Bacteroidota bacterium]
MSNDRLPPSWINRLLRALCKDDLVEEIEGDLLEFYKDWNTKYGRASANRRYLWHSLKFLRPYSIKRMTTKTTYPTMFFYYLKVAWRSLLKHRMYATIKVGGFAIGVAAFLLISLFLWDEVTYDQHYEQGDRLFRVVNQLEGEDMWTSFPAPASTVIRENYSGIETIARLIPYNGWFDAGDNQFRKSNDTKSLFETGFAYADPELLDILEVPMIYGTRDAALSQPRSIVISRRKAEKYYPNQDPVGQQLFLNENTETPYVIGGVMENFPKKSHVDFDFFITLSQHEFWPGEQSSWCCWNYNVYLRLNDGTDPLALGQQLKGLSEYVAEYQERNSPSEAEITREKHSFVLQPLDEIHLPQDFIHDTFDHGSWPIVWLFVAIGTMVLLLACINFVNLSTAKAANRAKEVGIRKVVGSGKRQFVHQFLTESFVVCLLAVVVALILVALVMPYFNSVTQKSLSLPWLSWWFLPGVLVFVAFVTVFSGLYPAFYLSRFRPIQVIRGNLSLGSKNTNFRSVMVIFQFAASIIIIVGALLVYQQLNFILNKDLGFEKERVLLIHGVNTMNEKSVLFKEEIKNLSAVTNAALTSYIPISGTRRDTNPFWLEGRRQVDAGVGAQFWYTDRDYLETLGMDLVAGREFRDMAQDSASIIINEEMARQLNLDDPLGARLDHFRRTWTVIGVVQDFHFESMTEEIGPLALGPGLFGDVMVVKLQSQDLRALVDNISEVWDNFMPNQPIRFTFMDDAFKRTYENVGRTAAMFTAFAILAIFIACLGLFGLSAFLAEQRRKEISIRKVLGATHRNLFGLLTFNFLKMIGIALVLAIPVAIAVMQAWLQDFEYAVPIGWEVFVIAGIGITFIALLTVSFESLKVIFTNPAEGLNAE